MRTIEITEFNPEDAEFILTGHNFIVEYNCNMLKSIIEKQYGVNGVTSTCFLVRDESLADLRNSQLVTTYGEDDDEEYIVSYVLWSMRAFCNFVEYIFDHTLGKIHGRECEKDEIVRLAISEILRFAS